MNKSKILIAIPLMAATLVAIIFASLAWFVGSTGEEATANGPALTAEESAYFIIGDVQTFENVGEYMGETGLSFYRYVDTAVGDYSYVYFDDGVYPDRPTVEQLSVRYNTYYFPYTVADTNQLDALSSLYWNDEENRCIVPASSEQIAMALNCCVYDEESASYVPATLSQIEDGLVTVYYYDGESYTEITQQQIKQRQNLYYGTIEKATPGQLEAGRYLYFMESEDRYVEETSDVIDEAKRIIYRVGQDAEDNPIYTIATVAQMEERMALRLGETEEVVSSEYLDVNGNANVYYYDGENYLPSTSSQVEAALRLYYKDRGEILSKDFKIYRFEGARWQEDTYYWDKVDDRGAYSYSIYSSGTVSQNNTQSTYKNGDSLYVEEYKNKGSSTVYYAIYDTNKTRVYGNDPSVLDNAKISKDADTITVLPPVTGTTNTYLMNRRAFKVRTTSNDIQSNTIVYYMVSLSDTTEYELVCDVKNNNSLTLYSIDGSTRKGLYYDTNDNTTILFTREAVTTEAGEYAGTLECRKRSEYKAGTCQTITYPDGVEYEAFNSELILQCTGVEGNYSYKILRNNPTRSVVLDSNATGVVITVTEDVMRMYAILDDATIEDEAYNLSKQFNVAFPGSSSDSALHVAVDRIGIVPLHDEAIAVLEEEGAVPQPVYYTYVDNGSVNFGLDVVRTGIGTSREFTRVTNYDGTQITEITADYTAYNAASHGYLTYVTSTGFQLYLQDSESAENYLAISNSTPGLETLADVEYAASHHTQTFYIKSGTRYLEYSDRHGSIVYSGLTSGNYRLFRRFGVEATTAQIDAGIGLFYWNGSAFTSATPNMIHANGTLYSDTSGTVATAQEIENWGELYYKDSDEAGNTEYVLVTFDSEYRTGYTLYYVSYAEATSEAIAGILDGTISDQELFIRSVTNEVYKCIGGLKGALLYGTSNGHSVSTLERTIYMLPESKFRENFYVEVDLYNFNEDIMLGTFFPDDDGVLRYSDGTQLVLDATPETMSYRCIVRIYFLDKESYYNLHNDEKLVYTYSDTGTPTFTVTSYSDIRPFAYSDYMYIGSNFLLRLNIQTSNISE